MTYKKAFPDFDYIPFLSMHDNWLDNSYANDVCPKFERETDLKNLVVVFFDYADIEKREDNENEKYYIAIYDINENYINDVLFTNNENEVRETLSSMGLI